MAPLLPVSLAVPPGLPAESWLRLLGRERGLVLFDRPDEEGLPASYLSFDPAPGSPLDYAPPPLGGPPPAPFFGGWAGAISLDRGRRFERTPYTARDEGWPDLSGGFYGFAVAVEQGGARTRLVAAVGEAGAGEALQRLRDRLAAVAERGLRGDLPSRPAGAAPPGPPPSHPTRAEPRAPLAPPLADI